eukprot:5874369-Pyramimonas_sp.AAC.4
MASGSRHSQPSSPRISCAAGEPIAGGEAVYTQHENQSQEGRQYLPSVRTNLRRGGSIYIPGARTWR